MENGINELQKELEKDRQLLSPQSKKRLEEVLNSEQFINFKPATKEQLENYRQRIEKLNNINEKLIQKIKIQLNNG